MKLLVNDIKENPSNPRQIKDEKFRQLIKSIKDFPEMLKLRPIVINADNMVLGGNMRLRACKEAGMTEVPVIRADSLTEAQQREFIIKDNIGFGEWEWEAIIADWPEAPEWGLDISQFAVGLSDEEMESFFKEDDSAPKEGMQKIVLEYTDEDFAQITEAFKKHSGSKEQIIFKLLIV